jgi:hypothetical protein
MDIVILCLMSIAILWLYICDRKESQRRARIRRFIAQSNKRGL